VSWLYGWMLDRTWADWWGMVQGLAPCATAGVAWYQLGALRDEQELRRRDEKAWRTLQACERFEGDVVIDNALRAIRDARFDGKLESDPRSVRLETILVFNYFEGKAIAAEQGFYVESIVREHLSR
jgi:hypothetical protein